MSASGGSLLNQAVNALPFELYYIFRAISFEAQALDAKRLARVDAGINPLGAACREHDIAYSHSNDLTDRHAADNILAEKARKRSDSLPRVIRL